MNPDVNNYNSSGLMEYCKSANDHQASVEEQMTIPNFNSIMLVHITLLDNIEKVLDITNMKSTTTNEQGDLEEEMNEMKLPEMKKMLSDNYHIKMDWREWWDIILFGFLDGVLIIL